MGCCHALIDSLETQTSQSTAISNKTIIVLAEKTLVIAKSESKEFNLLRKMHQKIRQQKPGGWGWPVQAHGA